MPVALPTSHARQQRQTPTQSHYSTKISCGMHGHLVGRMGAMQRSETSASVSTPGTEHSLTIERGSLGFPSQLPDQKEKTAMVTYVSATPPPAEIDVDYCMDRSGADGTLVALHVHTDEPSGCEIVSLYTDDGRGNGNCIMSLPLAELRQSVKQFNQANEHS